jgi:xanthine/CO dehydrogenase XdhC/CoxF family maturation factor
VKEIYEQVVKLIEQGEDLAVATVVKTRGSTPREVGAKMIVRRGGGIVGTVGGGCGEAEVWRTALSVIETRRPQTVVVDLTQEVSMNSEGVCGGIMEVFVEPWYDEDKSEA